MMSINPDAHSTREIDLTHWGVEMARKGGVPKECVLNCLSREEFAEYLARRHHERRGKRSAWRRRIPRTRAVAPKAKKAPPASPKRKSAAS
jgi:DNA polymerase (family 10)